LPEGRVGLRSAARAGLKLALLLTFAAAWGHSPALAGDWWDPSGALGLAPVQNALCQYWGVVCKRQNYIRIDTLDYSPPPSSPILLSEPDAGWQAFSNLGSGGSWLAREFDTTATGCVTAARIASILNYAVSDNGAFNGNLLSFAGQQWNFRPVTNLISAANASAAGAVETHSSQEVIFDFVSSLRHKAPRDIRISVRIQIIDDGVPQPQLERTYEMMFPKGADQFSESCYIPVSQPGYYDLTFLVSDDFFGEDEPIPVKLRITPR